MQSDFSIAVQIIPGENFHRQRQKFSQVTTQSCNRARLAIVPPRRKPAENGTRVIRRNIQKGFYCLEDYWLLPESVASQDAAHVVLASHLATQFQFDAPRASRGYSSTVFSTSRLSSFFLYAFLA